MSERRDITIIIPCYEPDERLLALLDDLGEADLGDILLVDDGSGEPYRDIFRKAEEKIRESGGVLLRHEVNRGKGAALKTAFRFLMENSPDLTGAVTADSDGQHDFESIRAVMEDMREHPDSLILGVRDFDREGIPWKSMMGNKITLAVMNYLCGIRVRDTQTGLRGIPASFFPELLTIKGDRFEFETEMLLLTSGRIPIREVPIKTIYDSEDHHSTHFDPWKDSFRIYRILAGRFIRYAFASLSSCVLDLVLFAIFCGLLRQPLPGIYISVSTVLARVMSATYNYTINYRLVFRSEERVTKSLGKYALLAVCQMALSAGLVTFFAGIFGGVPEVIVKAVVDTLLFIASYYIQRRFIF